MATVVVVDDLKVDQRLAGALLGGGCSKGLPSNRAR